MECVDGTVIGRSFSSICVCIPQWENQGVYHSNMIAALSFGAAQFFVVVVFFCLLNAMSEFLVFVKLCLILPYAFMKPNLFDLSTEIAEVIDERPDEVKQLEAFRTSNRWKVVGGN